MHLNMEVALDLIEGRLHSHEVIFWTRHLEICRDCVEGISELRQLETDLKRHHLKSALQQDLDNAIRVFPTNLQQVPSTARSIVAAIIFDSFAEPAAVGIRGTSPVARQIVMRFDEFDIHVKIWGDEDRKQMLGQLLPRKGHDLISGVHLHLLRSGERIESTVTDETGEFHFTDVPQASLSIQIDLPNLTVIGALNLQDAY